MRLWFYPTPPDRGFLLDYALQSTTVQDKNRIANLLLTVVNREVKRRWAFSNLVTAVRQMLMYYVDIFSFLENPERSREGRTIISLRQDLGISG